MFDELDFDEDCFYLEDDLPEIWFGAIYQGVDYSWRLEISADGRLRNAETQREYSLCRGDGGYLQACVSIHGRKMNVHIHRCVAETFLLNPHGYEIVNHIDGCKQHNSVGNLEWCTRSENYFHAVSLDLIDYNVPLRLGYDSKMGAYTGSCNGMSKLTESDVVYIRSVYVSKGKGKRCNRQELASQFGVSANLISKIMKGTIWRHIV